MSDEKLAYEYINKAWPNKGPCLVPNANAVNSNSALLSCHENDFCQCDMNDAFVAGLKAEREKSQKLVEAFRSHLDTMSEINAHIGYQFTQPLINAREKLKEHEKEGAE